jgi:exonuclease SbcC
VGLRESLATNQEKLSKAAQEHEETNNALGLLAEERKSLLGNLDPSDVEKTLGESRDKAEKLLGEARGSWEEKNMGLSLARQSESSLAQSLAKRETDLAVLENSFAKRLASFELSSEEDYLRAALPEAQRKALSEESKRLADSQLEILTQSREKANELEAKKNLRLTGESATELKEALGSLLAQKPSLIEEYSLKNGRLAENERQKERHLEGQQKYEQAVKDSRVWEKLDILIGSSDGKKYRNYVQILTFDTLLALANQRLEKMSPRYKLYHDRSRPLETMVRDEFQAGDIRPTKNLSGGESFIVSLSLALGLSKMAGEKVRVDSLFLDEGFGTLDEDALDAALDALSALRQDGKMIGLISHVPALTERIGARIEVSPVSAGRSVIEGPGCRKLG